MFTQTTDERTPPPTFSPFQSTTTPRSLSELVSDIQNGDLNAWPELVSRLEDRVLATLAKFNNLDPHLKNDAEGETWRTLFEKLGQVQNPESLPAWVCVVARNNALDQLRRRGRGGPSADIDAVLDQVGCTDRDRLVEAEMRIALRQAVSRLSPREQAIIRARVFTDTPEPLKRMGERLNMPTGSIGPTLGRSLMKLRKDPELRRFLADLTSGRPVLEPAVAV